MEMLQAAGFESGIVVARFKSGERFCVAFSPEGEPAKRDGRALQRVAGKVLRWPEDPATD